MGEQKGVYLDHNATTPLLPAARAIMLEMLEFPGNASSVHKLGRESRRRIEQARAQIATLVNAASRAVIIFTSGATEANNLVIKGSGCERIIVSAIEHPSVLNAVSEKEIIPVLTNGVIDLAALENMLQKNDRSTLISVMQVNNETGSIQPIDEVVALAKKYGALVHTDAVQAAGRIAIDLQKTGIDFITLSAHKIGGLQGVGCLVLSNCVTVMPLMQGGNQEKNLRAGTENLAGICAFGAAADHSTQSMQKYNKLSVLRDYIEVKIQGMAPETVIFGREVPRVANTSMFAVPGLPSETQLIALDLANIYVSNGSACSSGTVKSSHVLKAMGIEDALAGCALRVSLGWNTTQDDVDCFIEKWGEMYRRIQSRKEK
jgi:cysteine desulfurase